MGFHILFKFVEQRLYILFEMPSFIYKFGLNVNIRLKFLIIILDVFFVEFKYFFFQILLVLNNFRFKRVVTFMQACISNKSVSKLFWYESLSSMVLLSSSISFFMPFWRRLRSVTIRLRLALVRLKCWISEFIFAIYSIIFAISSSLGPMSLLSSLIL